VVSFIRGKTDVKSTIIDFNIAIYAMLQVIYESCAAFIRGEKVTNLLL